jgi:hypothetical protein
LWEYMHKKMFMGGRAALFSMPQNDYLSGSDP